MPFYKILSGILTFIAFPVTKKAVQSSSDLEIGPLELSKSESLYSLWDL